VLQGRNVELMTHFNHLELTCPVQSSRPCALSLPRRPAALFVSPEAGPTIQLGFRYLIRCDLLYLCNHVTWCSGSHASILPGCGDHGGCPTERILSTSVGRDDPPEPAHGL
jgi:hypothetical protein